MGGILCAHGFDNILRGELIFDRRRSTGFGRLRLSGCYRCHWLDVLEQLGKRVRLEFIAIPFTSSVLSKVCL